MSERKSKAGQGRGRGAGAAAGGRWSPMTLVLVGVGAVALLIVIWNVVSSATDQAARVPIVIEDRSPENLLRLAQPLERGEGAAPIVIMDFSDYSCPACRQFATQVKPILDAAYVDQGLIRFQYYDYILGSFPNSFLAARAARCAEDQGAYWAFHDHLYRAQDAWSRQADAAPSFEEYASQLGLDRGNFRSCLRSDRHAETVSANVLLGRELGVSGTPTIFLNTGEGRARRIEEWNNASQISALIDEAIERLGVTPAGGTP